MQREIAHTEHGGQSSARKCRTASTGLILIKSRGENLSREDGLDAGADSWNTSRSADKLDRVDLVERQARILEGPLEGSGDAVQRFIDELLVLLARELGGRVDIGHDGLHGEGSFGIGGQNLFELLGRGRKAERRLGVREHIDLVLCLKFFGEVLHKCVVDITAAEIRLIRGALDSELALGKGDHGGRQARVSDVDEDNMARILGFRKISLGDTVAKGDGSGIVDQTERVETGNGSSVKDSPSLDIGVPSRNGDDDIGNVVLELVRGDFAKLAQVHAYQLCGRESMFFTDVVDLPRKTRERSAS